MTPLSDKAQIVDRDGRPTRVLLAFFQSLFSGVIVRTGYTAAELAAMPPTQGATAFCIDSSVTAFNSVVAGGGSSTVPVFGTGAAWRVG